MYEFFRLYYSVSLLKYQPNFQSCKYQTDELDLQILIHGHKFQESRIVKIEHVCYYMDFITGLCGSVVKEELSDLDGGRD